MAHPHVDFTLIEDDRKPLHFAVSPKLLDEEEILHERLAAVLGREFIENAVRLGLPVPKPFEKALAAIRDQADKEPPPADGSGDMPGDPPPDQQGQTLFDLDDDIPPEEQEIKW